MTRKAKVAWQEGSFIYPQHFQQQDAFLENLTARYHLLNPHYNSVGFLEYEIDRGALAMRKFSLKSCKGVLPDGTLFQAPEEDPLPSAINLPAEYKGGYVYLGTSLEPNIALEAAGQRAKDIKARHLCSEKVLEAFNGKAFDTKKINTCELNLNVLLEIDDLGDMCYLPIAKVCSSSDGIFLKEDYIPPLLRVKASPILAGYLSQVLGLLTKYVSLNAKSLDASSGEAVGKYENFMILHTIARYKYAFSLAANDAYCTPKKLFENMVALIGDLSVFVNMITIEESVTAYIHEDIAGSFTPLIEIIEQIFLSLTRKVAIKLQFILGEGVHTVKIPEKVPLESVDCTVEISFGDKQAEAQNIISKVKVASAEDIRRIIAAQVSGIKFAEVKTLPSYIPYNQDSTYLQIETLGQLWQKLVSTREAGVYLPNSSVERVTLWIISR